MSAKKVLTLIFVGLQKAGVKIFGVISGLVRASLFSVFLIGGVALAGFSIIKAVETLSIEQAEHSMAEQFFPGEMEYLIETSNKALRNFSALTEDDRKQIAEALIKIHTTIHPDPTPSVKYKKVSHRRVDSGEVKATFREATRAESVVEWSQTNHDVIFYYIAQAGWPESEWKSVFKRIMCESSGNPGAQLRYKGNYHTGLMQISDLHKDFLGWTSRSELKKPHANLVAARLLWERDGWRPWTDSNPCYRHGPNMDSRSGRDGWNWMPNPRLALLRITNSDTASFL